jgi:methionine synthase II (cobalamin-independent)
MQPKLKPFATTAVGSFPHLDGRRLSQRLVGSLDIPAWPQLSKRSFRENMYVQYSACLPAVRVDDENEKITFDTSGDLSQPLEEFYTHYLAEDLDAFGLAPEYAAGFYDMLAALQDEPGNWVKGQVTGPISVGLTVTDQDLRASLYNEMLADALVKNAAMNARWQIQKLRERRPNVIISVDEPYLAAFGSAFISLERPQVITMLDEVFEAIQQEDALASVHCCANTDWSVLLSTKVDILNLDAYGYLENLALYPAELRQFLDRGGAIMWGIVPNNEEIFQATPDALADKLREGQQLIRDKAQARGIEITTGELAERSLITSSCGLGPATVEIADRTLDILVQTGELLNP